MRTNTKASYSVKTHGGAPAFPHVSPIQQLRRSVLSCLLWENTFYEDGKDIVSRISEAAAKVSSDDLSLLAIEARSKFNLRHVPLLLAVILAKRGGFIVSDTIFQVVQRADELTEFLSLYWKDGKVPLSKQVKKGLAKAFQKFDAYQLAKYNRDNAIKLKDVLFLCHANPKDEKQATNWKQLIDGTLASPDTWEVELSAGKDKKATFERLINAGNLGYLALLRNLRNMMNAGVNRDLIKSSILARQNGAHRVLPFRFVAAARACPQLESTIDQALCATIEALPELPGTTVVLVDVSGSMDDKLSDKSDLRRIDAAAALASIIKGDLRVFTFSNHIVEVPARRGMSGVDAVINSQSHGGTKLARAVKIINEQIKHDRFIVITDEQATDGRVPMPACGNGYMINVGTYQNGVGYGEWKHIDGFSENVIRWIIETENDTQRIEENRR